MKYNMVDWSIILCANNHKTGNGTGTGRRIVAILASLVLESEQLSRTPLYDNADIDHDETDTFKPWSTTSSDTDILSLIHFSGDEDLQSRLRTLCREFAVIFSNDFPKEPADIPPFNLIVDDTKWKVGKNRAPPQSQSSVKQAALFKTLQTLISQGIVEKSQSPHYSQILMVPKPDMRCVGATFQFFTKMKYLTQEMPSGLGTIRIWL